MSTDVGTWTNWLTFKPDPDYSPDAGTGLLSPISYALQRGILLRRENLTYSYWAPVAAAMRGFKMVFVYTSLFAQKEQNRKKTIKKQRQTTKQTGINAALTMISYHMTCYAYLRVITEESVLKEIFQVIDIVDDFHVVRKYSSRQFLLSSKINYRCGCHLTGISEGIWLYKCLFGKWLVKMWKFLTISNYSNGTSTK